MPRANHKGSETTAAHCLWARHHLGAGVREAARTGGSNRLVSGLSLSVGLGKLGSSLNLPFPHP